MGTISFSNNQVKLLLKNKSFLKAFIEKIFLEERFQFKSISFIFCTDEYLLKLNQDYLNHDTYTDILTFSLGQSSLPIISEIYISIDRVRENASSLEVSFENELHRVMIHGILHLCGYSDHTPTLKAHMRRKEDYYLSQISFT